jgi:hypothetical protein
MNAYSAGTYPVQVNTMLIPPYSLSLSDYSSGLTEKLAITLLNRDLMQPQLKVKLRLTIKCASDLTLRTKPDVWFEPIVLDAGIPTRLTLEEVMPYFLLKNLDVQGYMKGDALPEGLIEFQVEVFEYSSGVSISMNTVSVAHLSLPKPPKLIQPENGKIIPLVDPTNLLFQWAPQYFGNTGAINYEFILKELPANILSIEDAFLSAPTVYQSTHESTSFLYSASEPALQVGKKYAWAVRSILNQDTDPNIRLDNNGYSTINSFDVSELNLPPTGINATVTPEGEIDLKWTPRMNHTKFVVTFSRDDQEPKVWHDIQTTEPNAKISNIAPGYAYVFRIGAYCASIAEPTYSNYSTVKVSQSEETVNPDCGKKPTIEITNRNPIEKLDVDDKIMVGDFPVRLTQVTGGGGTFSGTGVTFIPYLNSNLSVTFSNIGVNTDKCLISGMVSVDVDKNESGLVNLDALDQGGTGGKVVAGVAKVDKVLDFTMPEKLTMQYTPETGTMEFFDGSTSVGSVDIPKNKAAESDFPVTVEDKDGNVYEIQENPEKSSNNDAAPYVAVKLGNQEGPILDGSMSFTSLAQNEGVVTFENDDTSQYAIDQTQDYYQSVMIIKDKYQLLDGKYKVKWKYIPPGKTEQIIAKLDNKNNIDPTKVKFKTRVGKVYESAYNSENNTYTITLVGGQDADGQELFAIYPSTTPGIWSNLGKLNIISYTPVERSLVLVKTLENDDTEAGKVEDELNQIYNPVGVNWTVSSEQFTYNADGLFEGGSGILSTYLPNMRTLNAAFKADKAAKGLSIDSKAAYLFLVNQAAGGDRDKQGFMPRGMQFGYINTEAFSSSPRGAIIAHELGHGVFRLYHTFNANYGDVAVGTQGSTDNLMDYKGGTELAKWQWDMIYDPAILNGLFDGDKEGEIKLANDEYLGFTPDGDVIKKWPENIIAFYATDSYFVTGFKMKSNDDYIWNTDKHCYKSSTGEFIGWDSNPVNGRVAIWNPNYSSECFKLYKFVDIVNYKKDQFSAIQATIQTDDGKGWILDIKDNASDACKSEANDAIRKCAKRRTLLFVNGYRLAIPENHDTDNSIQKIDSKNYWDSDIVNGFIDRLKSGNVFYADGHMSISTSNHKTIGNFYCSAKNTIAAFPESATEAGLKYADNLLTLIPEIGPEIKISIDMACLGSGLDIIHNDSGFLARRKQGLLAGTNFLNEMKANKTIFKNKDGLIADTLDIVCHSMGYAYALGMIDALKDKVPFGRFYIIAPENPGSISGDDNNFDKFTEVWQYGSNEAWSTDKQDGIAPQEAVKNIEQLPTENTKGGRVFIPINNNIKRGFYISHTIGNYKWIFDIKPNQGDLSKGYVVPRGEN